MPTSKPQYQHDAVEIAKREVVYRGFFKMEKFRIRHRLFAGDWSDYLNRELFVRGDAVAAILYDPVHDLIGLIEQFRIGALNEDHGPWCLEAVAGMTKPEENPEEVIHRELKEEAGFRPDKLEYICNYLSSPGGTDEKLHLYCALGDLDNAGGIYGLPEEGEDILLRVFAAEAVFDAMLGGRTNNAATVIGLQWLQLNRDRLRQEAG